MTQLPGRVPAESDPHEGGTIPRPSQWFSPSAFFEGQHRSRLDPDERTG
ncbi:hypothetical protein GGQ69_001298 [Micrococcus sp. TA1]|nr:hypothetical protein [Micrococcus sp. TA1]